MSKKTIIQLVVISLAFGAAGLVLYNGLFKSGNSFSSDLTSTQAQPTPQVDILPYGQTLEFNRILYRQNFQYDLFTYPKLSPGQDVGVPEDTLVIPPPQQTP